MATEQYSIGYEEGFQDGWNAAVDSLSAQRKPLTEEEMADFLGDRYHSMTENELEFFRLGEAAHNIKENA